MARSYAYRWGEEGIGGFCDIEQVLCLAPAFWNGKDPILKERLFGLTNQEGNHGEDLKELYFHLDSSPTHSYCKYLYKYHQATFPYMELLQKNRKDRLSPEFEILDTAVFNNNRYFDCFIEYAKAGTTDILMKITVHNRGTEDAAIHVLPHIWFRNFCRHNPRFTKPEITSLASNCIQTNSSRNGTYYLYHDNGEQMFCENETNSQRIFHTVNETAFVKDGINNYVVNEETAINSAKKGTKAAVWLKGNIAPGSFKIFKVRLTKEQMEKPWVDFDEIFKARMAETDGYYNKLAPDTLSKKQKDLLRNTVGGLLWGKQFYYFDVFK